MENWCLASALPASAFCSVLETWVMEATMISEGLLPWLICSSCSPYFDASIVKDRGIYLRLFVQSKSGDSEITADNGTDNYADPTKHSENNYFPEEEQMHDGEELYEDDDDDDDDSAQQGRSGSGDDDDDGSDYNEDTDDESEDCEDEEEEWKQRSLLENTFKLMQALHSWHLFQGYVGRALVSVHQEQEGEQEQPLLAIQERRSESLATWASFEALGTEQRSKKMLLKEVLRMIQDMHTWHLSRGQPLLLATEGPSPSQPESATTILGLLQVLVTEITSLVIHIAGRS